MLPVEKRKMKQTAAREILNKKIGRYGGRKQVSKAGCIKRKRANIAVDPVTY